MHDINKNNAPLNMLYLYEKTFKIHSYNTRSSASGKFYVKSARLEIQKRSFSRLRVKLWKEMPCPIRDLPKKTFKKVLCKWLFEKKK